jgi:hypothetical protein
MKKFRFKNVLKESLGKTLQLSFAPDLAMSRFMWDSHKRSVFEERAGESDPLLLTSTRA